MEEFVPRRAIKLTYAILQFNTALLNIKMHDIIRRVV